MITQGTVAMFNIYSVHMDGSYWVDPEVFRPERHLTAEGKLIKTDHLMPFGNGDESGEWREWRVERFQGINNQ